MYLLILISVSPYIPLSYSSAWSKDPSNFNKITVDLQIYKHGKHLLRSPPPDRNFGQSDSVRYTMTSSLKCGPCLTGPICSVVGGLLSSRQGRALDAQYRGISSRALCYCVPSVGLQLVKFADLRRFVITHTVTIAQPKQEQCHLQGGVTAGKCFSCGCLRGKQPLQVTISNTLVSNEPFISQLV